ncbi:hypothetical protein G6F57_004092 [Rhizopus arrhizus]|nr:hypothetical protein G6F24_003877 [Rhizopus arrhizus]KAG1422462.1 hypothetical protein G6F58_003287 [Rhizopus delemar]KAG0915133.1 hypothetical protein G6F33_003613 [Rhizopus arrhizus]KAG0943091.1 hypothetical protein G6F30_005416 [Rhizopus arrhizus]KAG0957684.1 hypothetical protein G6F32_000967 [Rhizopus arrhizus]
MPIPNKNCSNLGRPLATRKNACIICAVCFTCSGYYGINCQCIEMQPRRGKNLPQNGLDSRAKKLNKQDKEDYEFTTRWLSEFTHSIYRDEEKRILGLKEMTEVSLCKAHSSTLYRAKKKHQRGNQDLPINADSNGTNYSNNHSRYSELAAKLRDLPYEQPHAHPDASPSFTKRKRSVEPSLSISTPLLTHNIPYLLDTHQTPSYSFSSQLLPPLRNNSLNSLTYSLRHQLSFMQQQPIIETVSLRSLNNSSTYYIRNLAITDTYTFRDLLSEIDLSTPPPPGKRIVISDIYKKKLFPLNQPIRSVIPNPNDTHIEFYLGLSDKASIDWNIL